MKSWSDCLRSSRLYQYYSKWMLLKYYIESGGRKALWKLSKFSSGMLYGNWRLVRLCWGTKIEGVIILVKTDVLGRRIFWINNTYLYSLDIFFRKSTLLFRTVNMLFLCHKKALCLHWLSIEKVSLGLKLIPQKDIFCCLLCKIISTNCLETRLVFQICRFLL